MSAFPLFTAEKLLQVLSLSQNATAVYTGKDVVIQTANDAMLGFWGKDRSIIGKPLEEAVPELTDQPFINQLKDVWYTGVTYTAKNTPAHLFIDGRMQTFYYDVECRAILNSGAETECILHTATDVTELYKSRQALNTTRVQLDLALASASMGSWIIRPETRSLSYSPIFDAMFGYKGAGKMSYDAVLGQLVEGQLDAITATMSEAIRIKGGYDLTYAQRRFDDGRIIWLRSTGRAAADDEGKIVLTGVVMDITKQVNARDEIEQLNNRLFSANEELTASNEELAAANEEQYLINEQVQLSKKQITDAEEMLRLAIDAANIGTWNIEPKTRALIYNARLAQIFGYEGKTAMTYDEAIGQVSENYRDKITAEIEKAITTGGFYDITYSQWRFNDGELIWLRSTGQLSRDNTGNSTSFSGVVVDITEQVKAREAAFEFNEQLTAVNEELTAANEELAAANEEQYLVNDNLHEFKRSLEVTVNRLQISDKRFQTLVRDSPVGIIVLLGKEMRVELVNDAYARLIGRKAADLQDTELFTIIPETEEYFRPLIKGVLDSGTPLNLYETPYTVTTGNETISGYLNVTYQPYKEDDDKIMGVMVTCNDITEQVTLRKQAEQAKDTLRLAVEAADLGTFSINVNNFEWYASPRLKELFGYGPGEAMPYEAAINQIHPTHRQAAADLVTKAVTDGVRFDMEYPILSRINDAKVRWVRGIGTVQKDTAGNNQFFTGIVHDITDQVTTNEAIQNLNGQLSAINEQLTVSNEELAEINNELTVTQLGLKENEERFRQISDNIAQLAWMADATGYIFWYNKRWYDYTGTTLEDMQGWGWDKVHHPDHLQSVVKAWTRDLENGEVFELTFPLRSKDGEYRWFLTRAVPLKDNDGKVLSWFGTNTDVTEQRQDDQRKNDFIGMVSHELKTPLTSLSAYLQMMAIKASKTDDGFTKGALEKANKQIRKMTTMINGFLNVSRLESGKIHIDTERFDMALLVKEVEEESIATITSHQIIFAPVNETFIMADRDKIGQVINNFISNAVKYSPAGSTIRIACVTKNNNAELRVEDEGYGINTEDQEKLFDRFYRVKNKDMHTISGFGIGLYLCAEIVQRHNGKIWVQSQPGKGSAFYFSLPVNIAAKPVSAI